MDSGLVKFLIALAIGIPLLLFGIAHAQQKTIKTTCGVNVSVGDALFYDLEAASCPLVTIKK